MHKVTPGIGPGAYFEEQIMPAKDYAPMRALTKDMTMSDKGPGSYYRAFPEPTDDEQAAEVSDRNTFVCCAGKLCIKNSGRGSKKIPVK